MMRSILKFSLLPGVLAAALGGCVASGGAEMSASVSTTPAYVDASAQGDVEETAYVEPASYVYVAPDVEVIADYDEPVFFSGGVYWRYENDTWYSSSYHDRGWIEAREVPEHVRGIDHPASGYVHVNANVSARPGEVGYVRSSSQVHVVHAAPPPKYVERPPAQRGGTNYRPPIRNGRPVQTAPAHQTYGGTSGHAPPAAHTTGGYNGGTEAHGTSGREPGATHEGGTYGGTPPEAHGTSGHEPPAAHTTGTTYGGTPPETHGTSGREPGTGTHTTGTTYGGTPPETHGTSGREPGATHTTGSEPNHGYQPAHNTPPAHTTTPPKKYTPPPKKK